MSDGKMQYFKNIPDGTPSEVLMPILVRVFKKILVRYNYQTDASMFEGLLNTWLSNEPDILQRFPYLENPKAIVTTAYLLAYNTLPSRHDLEFDTTIDEFDRIANQVAAVEMKLEESEYIPRDYERLSNVVLKQLAKERNIAVRRRDGKTGQPLKEDYIVALKVWDGAPLSRARKSNDIYSKCSPSRRNEIERVSKIGELKTIAKKYKVPGLNGYKLADINSLKQIICQAGKTLTKAQADKLLIAQLQELIRKDGYRGIDALEDALSSIVARGEANGEHWAVFYKDDVYDDAVKDIAWKVARDFEEVSSTRYSLASSPPRSPPASSRISQSEIYADCSPSRRNRIERESRIGEIKKIAKEFKVPNLKEYKLATINALKKAICEAGKTVGSKEEFTQMLINKLLDVMRVEGRKGLLELHFILRKIISEAQSRGEPWVEYYTPEDNVIEEAERLFIMEMNDARQDAGIAPFWVPPSAPVQSPSRSVGQCSSSVRSEIEGIKTIGELKKIARKYGVPGIDKYKLVDLAALKQAICDREKVLRENPLSVPPRDPTHIFVPVKESTGLEVKEDKCMIALDITKEGDLYYTEIPMDIWNRKLAQPYKKAAGGNSDSKEFSRVFNNLVATEVIYRVIVGPYSNIPSDIAPKAERIILITR